MLKKLIEVALPLEAINKQSAREYNSTGARASRLKTRAIFIVHCELHRCYKSNHIRSAHGAVLDDDGI